jgi:hypothetical protein
MTRRKDTQQVFRDPPRTMLGEENPLHYGDSMIETPEEIRKRALLKKVKEEHAY